MPPEATDEAPQTEAQTEGGAAPSQSFTQADVDKIVEKRLERERAKYADYAELKAKAARVSELERQQMSDQERLTADMAALKAEAETARRERDEALARAQQRMIQAEVTALAGQMGFRYPGDIYRLIDAGSLTVDDSGAPTGVKEALEALAKERPDYLAKPAAPRLDGQAGGQTGNDLPRLTPEQERVAKKLGITSEAYAKRLAAQLKE